MSVSAGALPAPSGTRSRLSARLALAAGALALAGLVLWVVAAVFATPAPVPVKAPFGLGMREAAPAPSGLGGFILAYQGAFYQSLQRAVLALQSSGAAFWTLVGLGFAYGIFHAAGPGHGKAVIAGYLVANERRLLKGVGLSLAAALIQALVAIALVSMLFVALQATQAVMNQVTRLVEIASFALVAALGAVLVWRKSGKVLDVAALARAPLGAAAPAAECDHVHLPPPEALDRLTGWRDMAGVALAAGVRPCTGAIVVLVFAGTQGLYAAGVAATFAMALGTALTTSAIAALAVVAKGLALRLAGGRGMTGALAVTGLELLAAAFVLVLGLALLAGLWGLATGG